MGLSPSAKSSLYLELHRYVHAGVDLPRAIDSFLTERSAASLRSTMARVQNKIQAGESVEQAFTDSAFSKIEQALIGAAETSGRLEQALSYLSTYFQTIADTRRTIQQDSAYPLFLLHFAAILLPIPAFVTDGPGGYLLRVAAILVSVYTVALTLWFTCWVLARMSESDSTMDSVVQSMPVFGTTRRNMALARFFASLEMLINAGVNLPQALERAGDTTHSAVFQASVRKAIPQIERGVPVDEALRAGGGFPEQVLRGIRVGVDTGSLDVEMGRWGKFYWQKAHDSIRAISKWLPRILYLMIAIGVGVGVIRAYQKIWSSYNSVFDF